eukprot:3194574-Alexandrium_andersonii.AAC.1
MTCLSMGRGHRLPIPWSNWCGCQPVTSHTRAWARVVALRVRGDVVEPAIVHHAARCQVMALPSLPHADGARWAAAPAP